MKQTKWTKAPKKTSPAKKDKKKRKSKVKYLKLPYTPSKSSY